MKTIQDIRFANYELLITENWLRQASLFVSTARASGETQWQSPAIGQTRCRALGTRHEQTSRLDGY